MAPVAVIQDVFELCEQFEAQTLPDREGFLRPNVEQPERGFLKEVDSGSAEASNVIGGHRECGRVQKETVRLEAAVALDAVADSVQGTTIELNAGGIGATGVIGRIPPSALNVQNSGQAPASADVIQSPAPSGAELLSAPER